MLSSTSISSTGNIHRRVIVFPFVVPSVVERSCGGVRVGLAVHAIWMDFSLQMNTVQGSEGLLSDPLRLALTKGSRSGVQSSVQVDAGRWSKCVTQLFMTTCPRSWSKSEIKWFIFLVLAGERRECSLFLELSTRSVKSACEDISDAEC